MHLTRFLASAVAAAALLVIAGCSEETQLDFVQDNADSFMAACASTNDPLIQAEICQCVVDTAQVRFRFSEFEAIEADLTADRPEGEPLPPLPPEVVEILAECVIEVGEL